jgi:Mrp family chromosome partitioning ATPase
MKNLLEAAAMTYDLVVIDSPPLMAVSDARVLSRLADATVLIVRWGAIRGTTVKWSVKQLETAGAKLAGTLLSMVNVKQYAAYSYGDSGAKSGDHAKYYVG